MLVETALVVPVLLLLLVVAVDLGRACTIAIAAESAAHAGAVYGTLHPSDTAGMIAAAKTDATDWSAVVPTATYDCRCSDGSSIESSCSSEPSGCAYNSVYNVQVLTTASFMPLLSYAGFAGFTLHGKASLRASR